MTDQPVNYALKFPVDAALPAAEAVSLLLLFLLLPPIHAAAAAAWGSVAHSSPSEGHRGLHPASPGAEDALRSFYRFGRHFVLRFASSLIEGNFWDSCFHRGTFTYGS